MKDKIEYITFHEAGHAVAHILAGIPFKYVTIKEKTETDENGNRSLGHIMFDKTKDDTYWNRFNFLNPVEFNEFFRDDFTKLAGLVAEGLYRRKPNYKAAKEDFRQWVGSSLKQLPDGLESRYIDFILEYTIQVIKEKSTWSHITAVALALVEEETLSYKRVCEVIDNNKVNPVII